MQCRRQQHAVLCCQRHPRLSHEQQMRYSPARYTPFMTHYSPDRYTPFMKHYLSFCTHMCYCVRCARYIDQTSYIYHQLSVSRHVFSCYFRTGTPLPTPMNCVNCVTQRGTGSGALMLTDCPKGTNVPATQAFKMSSDGRLMSGSNCLTTAQGPAPAGSPSTNVWAREVTVRTDLCRAIPWRVLPLPCHFMTCATVDATTRGVCLALALLAAYVWL